VQSRRKSVDDREESGLPSLAGSAVAGVAGEAPNHLPLIPSGMVTPDIPTCVVEWSALQSAEMELNPAPLSAMTPLPPMGSPMTDPPNTPISPWAVGCHSDQLRSTPSTPLAALFPGAASGGIGKLGRRSVVTDLSHSIADISAELYY
jgi:hypothetical protein